MLMHTFGRVVFVCVCVIVMMSVLFSVVSAFGQLLSLPIRHIHFIHIVCMMRL